jgi:hypothetical protein
VARPKDTRDRTREEVKTVGPLLRNLLEDEDAEVRRNATRTLKHLSRIAPEVTGKVSLPDD